MAQQRRTQRQKGPRVQFVQDLRRSNAAQPIPSATDYRRKPKHGIKWEDDTDNDFSAFEWLEE